MRSGVLSKLKFESELKAGFGRRRSALRKMERFVSEKGNGLRAAAGFKAGDVIHSAEPFCACVSTKLLPSTCSCCFSRSDRLMRCSQCKITRYCNAHCQKEAWPEHKLECKCLKGVSPNIPPDSIRLTARIIVRLLSDPAADSNELYSIKDHKSHLEDMSEEKRAGLDQLCSMLKIYMKSHDLQIPPSLDPITLLAQVTCNCFSISNGELQDIGVGLYLSMSLLNHDCRPNCVMMFVGKKLQLRAIRSIHPSEELCISYTDVLAPRDERQTQLNQQFHFLCQCQRCSDEKSDFRLLEGNEAIWIKLKESLHYLEELRGGEQWEELQKETQDLIGCYSSAVPDSNVYMLRCLDVMMDACISLGQYDTALQYGRRTLAPYQLHYPDPHPSRAVELLRVAKLQHYLRELEEAERTFVQAYDVMKVTHGDNHPLLTEVKIKLEECAAERRHQSPSSF